jgi:quercetin dioxygenase-like cupin family protein
MFLLDATHGGVTMSSMNRTLADDVLVRHLKEDERMIDQTLLARHGRSARTLVKEGPLRLTLIQLAPGGSMAAHTAAGPVTMHVIEGEITFSALSRDYVVKAGDILVMAPGVEHAVRSAAGGVFLLTVVHPEPDGTPAD